MRSFSLLLLLAATLLVAINAASTEKLASGNTLPSDRTLKNNEGTSTRLLRAVDTTDEDDDDAAEEERGIQSAVLGTLSKWATKMKLPKTATNLQYRAWLKGEKDPKAVYQLLGFAGKDLALVKADPKYQLYLDYATIWNRMGGRYMT